MPRCNLSQDFLTEYYRQGYAMPENTDKEKNQKFRGKIFKADRYS